MADGIFKHSYKTKTRESLPIAIYNAGVQQCEPSQHLGARPAGPLSRAPRHLRARQLHRRRRHP